MIADKKVLAIIPARAGSKGLPGKNIKPLMGKPLLAWPIEAALGSSLVDKVIISTDSQAFADIAVEHGAQAPFLRPAEFASDTASSMDFIIHALDYFEQQGEHYDYLVLLEPTSPLTETADIDSALTQVVEDPNAEAIVGVTLMETTHPAFTVRVQNDGLIKPFMSESFDDLPRRQDLETLYCLDGSLYISCKPSCTKAMREKRSFCHDKTLPFIGVRYKSHEVDDLVDFVCIEAIANQLDVIKAAQ